MRPEHEHEGDAVSAYGALYESADTPIQAGYWQLEGKQRAAPPNGYEEFVVILEGGSRSSATERPTVLEAGDVIVYDYPIGPKQLRSCGFKTALAVRFRGRGKAAQ